MPLFLSIVSSQALGALIALPIGLLVLWLWALSAHATPMTPMQSVSDPTDSRVATTEPEVQDIAYDSSYEADQKMAETTWQKWFTPADANRNTAATPMVEVSTPRPQKPAKVNNTRRPSSTKPQTMNTTNAKSNASSNEKTQSMKATTSNKKSATTTTATFRWNGSNATMTPSSNATSPASKTSTSTSNVTPMRMAPASNSRTPSKTPFPRKRADKAVIKPIDSDNAQPMQPASDDSDNQTDKNTTQNGTSSGNMKGY